MHNLEFRDLAAETGGETLFRGLNLRAGPGLTALLLPEHAEKAALAEVLVGALPPARGTVLIDGFDPASEPRDAFSRLGFAPRVPPLFPEMTVRAFARFTLEERGLPAGSADLARLLASWELGRVQNARCGELTPSLRQRLNLLQAMAGTPPVLVIDDILRDLDPRERYCLRERLRVYAGGDTGPCALLLTASVSDACICDRVFVLRSGEALLEGTPEDLMNAMGRSGQYEMEIAADRAAAEEALKAIPGIRTLEVQPIAGGWRLRIGQQPGGNRGDILASLVRAGVDVLAFGVAHEPVGAWIKELCADQRCGGEMES